MTQIPGLPTPAHQPPPVDPAALNMDGRTDRCESTTVEPDAVERNEYARLWNAVADALIAHHTRRGESPPRFSERNRAAALVWRTLHPDSQFGTPAETGDTNG